MLTRLLGAPLNEAGSGLGDDASVTVGVRATTARASSVDDAALESEALRSTSLSSSDPRLSADSALVRALRRRSEDQNCPDDVFAGFNSAI